MEDAPQLVLFYSPLSGRCRRTDGFLAQVLQRRGNHTTFRLYRVDVNERPDLAKSFQIGDVPTLVVVEQKQVRRQLVDPRGCRAIEAFLEPWLR